MERGSRRSWCIHRERVAFQAKQIYVAALEQTRIAGAVRRMAGDAALSLDGRVLPGEGTCFVSVAVKANLVLGGGGAQLTRQEAAVLVVAVGAIDQAFIHPMVEGLGEIRLHFLVAGVAQSRLRGFQQLPVDLGRMDGVAIHASHIVLEVLRTKKIAVLFAELVAA